MGRNSICTDIWNVTQGVAAGFVGHFGTPPPPFRRENDSALEALASCFRNKDRVEWMKNCTFLPRPLPITHSCFPTAGCSRPGPQVLLQCSEGSGEPWSLHVSDHTTCRTSKGQGLRDQARCLGTPCTATPPAEARNESPTRLRKPVLRTSCPKSFSGESLRDPAPLSLWGRGLGWVGSAQTGQRHLPPFSLEFQMSLNPWQ